MRLMLGEYSRVQLSDLIINRPTSGDGRARSARSYSTATVSRVRIQFGYYYIRPRGFVVGWFCRVYYIMRACLLYIYIWELIKCIKCPGCVCVCSWCLCWRGLFVYALHNNTLNSHSPTDRVYILVYCIHTW